MAARPGPIPKGEQASGSAGNGTGARVGHVELSGDPDPAVGHQKPHPAGPPGAGPAALGDHSAEPGRDGPGRPQRSAVPPTTADFAPTGRTRLQRLWSNQSWLFGLVTLAVLVRLAAWLAYYPALEFNGDSYSYLWNSQNLVPNPWHPLVYPIFLHVLAHTHLLAVVPLVQHALGLVTGLLIYRLLRSFGVGDFGAALGAAPVLLDAYQIDVEQVILSEALFQFLLVAGLYVLLTRRHTVANCALAGGLLGVATLTRTVSLPCAGAALLVLAVRRAGGKPFAAAAAAMALPLAGYAVLFHSHYGRYALTNYNGREFYGEVATFARCEKLTSATDRLLCPQVPLSNRASSAQYTWSPGSPLMQLETPPIVKPDPDHPVPPDLARAAAAWRADQANIAADSAAATFSRHVIVNQPLDYLRDVAGIVVHYFEPGRHTGPRDFPEISWQFPARIDQPPPWNIDLARMGFRSDVVEPHLNRHLAQGLRAYQRMFYLPGPLLLVALILGVYGAARRRRDPRALIAVAFVMCGLGMLVIPSLGAGFEYRYVLPAQLFLPAAGVLGASLLVGTGRTEPTRWAAVRGRFRRHPRVAVVGTATVAVLGLGANTAGADMLPVNRMRANSVAEIGLNQRLPGGRLEVQAGSPALSNPSCVHVGHRFRIGWVVSFPIHARLVHAGAAVVQADNMAVLGAARDRFLRPRMIDPTDPTKWRRVLPDVLLSQAHPTDSGIVEFVMTTTHGTLIYTDGAGAGVVAWRFDLATPPDLDFLPPGRLCQPSASAAALDRVPHKATTTKGGN